jgi:hypothetical protein
MLGRFSLLTSLILLLGLTSLLKAQTTATLLGHAVDTTGAIIPGAKIVVTNVGTNASRETFTDINGNYIVPQLPVGTYSATATMKGFATRIITDLTLSLGQNLRVDFDLSLGQVTESITVNGSGVAQVDTHSASISSEIEQTRVVDLPLNGRDPASLLGLIPGVSTLSVFPPRLESAEIRPLSTAPMHPQMKSSLMASPSMPCKGATEIHCLRRTCFRSFA